MRGPWPFGLLRKSAAQWFVRLRAASVTPRLDAKFRRWLASNPANEVDYERHELAWELAGELARDEEIERLLADAHRAAAQERRQPPRPLLAWAAAAAVLVAGVGFGVYLQWPSSAEIYMTAAGEQRTVVLPDRSRMVLNTSTRARVAFERGVRTIDLEYGEATFSVTHDAQRPFEVRAERGTARALGTEFNVFSRDGSVTVAVLSGKVEVLAALAANGGAGSSALLVHGEQVSYTEAGVSDIQPANSARITAWHSGRVAFDNVDLEDALREFNRYGGTPIVLADASLANVRVSGTFRIGETDALLQALGTAFDIDARRGAAAIELHARR